MTVHIEYKLGVFRAFGDHDAQLMKKYGWIYVAGAKYWRTGNIQRAAPFVDLCVGEAADRVRKFVNERQRLIADSVAATADVHIPVGKKAAADGKDFRPYQKPAALFQKARHKSLNGDVPRLGKSIESIGCLNLHEPGTIKRGLIIPPANAKIAWCQYWSDWSIHDLGVDYCEGSHNPESPVIVCNWDILSRHVDYFQSVEWDFIIPDEMHRLAHANSGRTRALFSLRASKHWLFLSGNPLGTRPKNLWPFLEFADSAGLGRSWWKYAHRYCDPQHNGFGWDFNGVSNPEELQIELRKRIMIRRDKKDVGADLPPNRQTIRLPKDGLSRLIRAERNAVQSNLADFERLVAAQSKEAAEAAARARGAEPEEIADPSLDIIGSAQQDLALAALPMMIKFINEQLETEEKVVVGAHHRAVTLALRDAFPGCAFVIGGLSTVKREAERVRFQEDPNCRVFIGNIAACCENLELSKADVVILAQLTWQHWQIDQFVERVWLPTKETPIQEFRLVVDGSASAEMADLIEKMQDSIERATVARRLESVGQSS